MTDKSRGETLAIQRLLGVENGRLSALQKHVLELQKIEKQLKTILPSPLCDHCVLANLTNRTLTLHTDSAAWAARLRFKTPEIIDCVKPFCQPQPPSTVRIKVVPPVTRVERPKRKLNISSKSAQHILDTANSINDTRLKESLLRLLKHSS